MNGGPRPGSYRIAIRSKWWLTAAVQPGGNILPSRPVETRWSTEEEEFFSKLSGQLEVFDDRSSYRPPRSM
jgi:hypothetical protein